MGEGQVFGDVADIYDRLRPTAPAAMYDDLLSTSELGPGASVLEIGCGTGLSTVELVRRGLDVTAIDPDPKMLEVARTRFDDVRFVEGRFEDYPTGTGRFDLIFGASSWHWVDTEVGLPLAASLLSVGGSLAVCWNHPRPEDSPRPAGLDDVFHRLAPELATTSQVVNKGHESLEDEISASSHFAEPAAFDYRWSCRLSTTDYCSLLSTHSDFRRLAPDRLARLLEDIAEVVNTSGGEIELRYETALYTARVSAR